MDAPWWVAKAPIYLLSGEILIPGFNRPVQSQAVNWATAGLLADPGRRCWPAFPAAPRRQQPHATSIEAASRAQHAPLSGVDYVFIMIMDASERARSFSGIAKDSISRQRFHIARTTSADPPVPCDRILIDPASGNGAAVRACA
jgi:hypothetical protein